MTTVEDVLTIARSQLGIAETPINRTPYGKWFGMDGNPWCAMFTSWVFDSAGLPIPGKTPKGYAYCPDGVNYFKRIGRFDTKPQVGDVVFYQFQGSVADHTGIVESIGPNGFTTIEGNTSLANQTNGGEVMRRNRFTALGFGRPAYDRMKGHPVPPMPKIIAQGDYFFDIQTDKFDELGNGAVLLDGVNGLPLVEVGDVVSVIPQGSAPARDGGYWSLPTIGLNSDGDRALLTFVGGRPKEPHVFRIVVR